MSRESDKEVARFHTRKTDDDGDYARDYVSGSRRMILMPQCRSVGPAKILLTPSSDVGDFLDIGNRETIELSSCSQCCITLDVGMEGEKGETTETKEKQRKLRGNNGNYVSNH